MYFDTYAGTVRALEGINLELYKNEVTGLVGETGSGKSMTALSILGLVPSPGKIHGGEIWFKGTNLLKIGEKELNKKRGKEIAMVFQDPDLYLNPLLRIGFQISEGFDDHNNNNGLVKNKWSITGKNETQRKRVVELLKSVSFPNPDEIDRYPHELSGGMKQRILLAMALACNPELMILDEPTTALDVTIQAQILELLKNIKKKKDFTVLYITHDLDVVKEICDRVALMYAGTIVEVAPVKTIFNNAKHPYLISLLKSMPSISEDKIPEDIPGSVPNLISPPPGCRFHPRCEYTMDICKNAVPDILEIEPNHWVACHLHAQA